VKARETASLKSTIRKPRMAPAAGKKDTQTVVPGGGLATPPRIEGVRIVELGNVLTRSGWMLELFRKDWAGIGIEPRQINWVELRPDGVTDWHRHSHQTDHLIGVGGVIKLALWDGRTGSPTYEESHVTRLGAMRPVLVIVPPGVWHAMRNESGRPAGYINITDQLYNYENPDNWRIAPGTKGIPDTL
jgi:dTDP-4-dehydrorhamnose 3,5-epimerase